jgi:hypothetical protein
MPMSGRSVSEDIREFHTGKTYSRTKSRYGKRTADRQAVAAAMSNKRRKHKGRKSWRASKHRKTNKRKSSRSR